MDTDDADITVEEREVDALHELLAGLSENETQLVLRIAAASIESQAMAMATHDYQVDMIQAMLVGLDEKTKVCVLGVAKHLILQQAKGVAAQGRAAASSEPLESSNEALTVRTPPPVKR